MKKKTTESQFTPNLKTVEETFRLVADTIPALIWITGADKLPYFFSKSWLDFTGRTMDQEIGNGWKELVHPEDLGNCLEVYHAAFNKKEPFFIEYRLRRHDGEYRWISVKGTPRFSTDGMFEGFTGGCMDVHEQKAFSLELEKKVSIRTRELEQATEAIRKSEERYHRMVEDVQEYAMLYLSKDGIIENWNKGAEKIKGYKAEEIIGKKFNVFYTLEDQQRKLPETLLKQAAEQGTTKHEGWRMRKDGTMFWGYVVITALFDEQKNAIGFSKVTRDLTEKKKAEDQLLQSEERYHRMVEDVQEYAILYLSKKGVIENWNKGAEKIKGYKAKEIVGKKFNVFYTLEDQQRQLPESLLKQAVEHGTIKHEGWRVRKDGTMFWGYVVITALFDEQNNTLGFSKVTRDLTEKKKNEDQIHDTNSQLINKANQLLEAQQLAHIGSWDWDVPGNKIYWSDELYRIIGLEPNEIEATYDHFFKYIHPDDKQLVTDLLQHAFETKQPYNFIHRVIKKDGSLRTISARVQVFTDESGNIIRLTGTQQDITEQKQFETELKESEERLLKIFNNNPIPMTFAEIKTNKIKYANKLFCSAFGYSEDEVIGHTPKELKLFSPEENERVMAIIMQALQETRTVSELQNLSVEETEELLVKLKQSDLIRNLEVLYTRKNGEVFPAIVSYETIRIGNERYTITSYQDITERKKVEELLKKQNEDLAKMNAELKSFAYISSHDLQEPLRKIQTFAARLLDKEYENVSENGRVLLNRMHDAAKRMQTLIKDLLDYSRMGNEERVYEHTDLAKLVHEVTEELQEEIQAKNAVIESHEMCSVNIIPFQFRQLLSNLIGNALKFSAPQQVPYIEIKSTTSKGSTFQNPQLQPDTVYCHVSIKDNGIGFEPQYSERIFEVFQRLHGIEKYKGTGIGLAIVKKIVDNHGGIITATGELNKGATFDMYIPVQNITA